MLSDDAHTRLLLDLHKDVGSVRSWRSKANQDNSTGQFLMFCRNSIDYKVHPDAEFFCNGLYLGDKGEYNASYYEFEHRDSETRFAVNVFENKDELPLDTIQRYFENIPIKLSDRVVKAKKKRPPAVQTKKFEKKESLYAASHVRSSRSSPEASANAAAATESNLQLLADLQATKRQRNTIENPPDTPGAVSVVLSLSGVSSPMRSPVPSPAFSPPAVVSSTHVMSKPPIEMVFQFVPTKVKESILAHLKEKDGFEFEQIEQALEMFEDVDDTLKRRFVERVVSKLDANETMHSIIKTKLELFLKLS